MISTTQPFPRLFLTALSCLAMLAPPAANAAGDCMTSVGAAFKQGHVLFKKHNFDAALPMFANGLATCRAAGDRVGISAGLFGYGQTLTMLNRFEESEKALLEGWTIRQTLTDADPDDELLIYPNEFMYLYRQWGKFEKAWQWGDLALAGKARKNGTETDSYATGASNLSGVALQTKEYARGLVYARLGMEVWRKIAGENSADHAWGMRDVGVLLFMMGRKDEAFGYLNKAYEIRLRAYGEDRLETQTSISDLAAWYTRAGDDRKALEFAEKAVTIARRTAGPEAMATSFALGRVVDAALRLGLPGQAGAAAEASLAIRRKQLGDAHHYTVGAWHQAATAALGENRLGRAEMASRTALQHCRTVHARTPATCAAQQITYGKTLLALGETAAALEAGRAASKLAQAADGVLGTEQASALLLAAQAEGALGRSGAMLEALAALAARLAAAPASNGDLADEVRQALLLARSDQSAAAPAALALLATEAEQLAARVAARRGMSHPAHGAALLDAAGIVQRLEQPARARRHGARALAIAIANGDAMLEARAATLLGSLDQGATAVFLGKQAVNALQSTRAGTTSLPLALQTSFVRLKRAAYVRLADRLLDERRIQEAETVLAMVREDQFHSLVRSEADARTTRLAFTGAEGALQQTVAQQSGALQRGAADLAGARTRQAQGAADGAAAFRAAEQAMAALLDGATDTLANLPQAAAYRSAAPSGASASAQPKGELRLTYLVTASRLRIVAQHGSTATVHDVAIDERDLARQIASLRQSAQHPGKDARGDAQALYRVLLAPVAPALARARSLTVAPGGVLRYLPFAMLHDGRKWLIERLPVTLSYSTGADPAAARPRAASLALFGQSRASGELPALPYVHRELLAVEAAGRHGQARGAPARSRIYLDQQFTAAALQEALPANSVVHIASHFVLRSGRAEQSYLLMGDGAPLTLAELGAATFRFEGLDLLTLSACETAVPAGTDDSGRELEGLAWLARQRGARNVLASLWRVSDQSTATLMGNFYGALSGNANKAAALRAAQLQQIRAGQAGKGDSRGLKALGGAGRSGTVSAMSRDHPYYWAGFALIGS